MCLGRHIAIITQKILLNGRYFSYRNMNQSTMLVKLEKQLTREQRSLSCKYKNLKKGEATQKVNIQKQKLKVQEHYHMIEIYQKLLRRKSFISSE